MSDWARLIGPAPLLAGGECVIAVLYWCYVVEIAELESVPCLA